MSSVSFTYKNLLLTKVDKEIDNTSDPQKVLGLEALYSLGSVPGLMQDPQSAVDALKARVVAAKIRVGLAPAKQPSQQPAAGPKPQPQITQPSSAAAAPKAPAKQPQVSALAPQAPAAAPATSAVLSLALDMLRRKGAQPGDDAVLKAMGAAVAPQARAPQGQEPAAAPKPQPQPAAATEYVYYTPVRQAVAPAPEAPRSTPLSTFKKMKEALGKPDATVLAETFNRVKLLYPAIAAIIKKGEVFQPEEIQSLIDALETPDFDSLSKQLAILETLSNILAKPIDSSGQAAVKECLQNIQRLNPTLANKFLQNQRLNVNILLKEMQKLRAVVVWRDIERPVEAIPTTIKGNLTDATYDQLMAHISHLDQLFSERTESADELHVFVLQRAFGNNNISPVVKADAEISQTNTPGLLAQVRQIRGLCLGFLDAQTACRGVANDKLLAEHMQHAEAPEAAATPQPQPSQQPAAVPTPAPTIAPAPQEELLTALIRLQSGIDQNRWNFIVDAFLALERLDSALADQINTADAIGGYLRLAPDLKATYRVRAESILNTKVIQPAIQELKKYVTQRRQAIELMHALSRLQTAIDQEVALGPKAWDIICEAYPTIVRLNKAFAEKIDPDHAIETYLRIDPLLRAKFRPTAYITGHTYIPSKIKELEEFLAPQRPTVKLMNTSTVPQLPIEGDQEIRLFTDASNGDAPAFDSLSMQLFHLESLRDIAGKKLNPSDPATPEFYLESIRNPNPTLANRLAPNQALDLNVLQKEIQNLRRIVVYLAIQQTIDVTLMKIEVDIANLSYDELGARIAQLDDLISKCDKDANETENLVIQRTFGKDVTPLRGLENQPTFTLLNVIRLNRGHSAGYSELRRTFKRAQDIAFSKPRAAKPLADDQKGRSTDRKD